MVGLLACGESTPQQPSEASQQRKDTVLVKVKHKDDLTGSSEASEWMSYHWMVGSDTLDFGINAAADDEGQSVRLTYSHKLPITIHDAVAQTTAVLPEIAEDFGGGSVRSLYLKTPIFYRDLASNLYDLVQAEYAKEGLNAQKQQELFEKSLLHVYMLGLGERMQSVPVAYSLEKFHVMKKEGYTSYLPESAISELPEFTIGGIGLHISFAKAQP